MARTSRLPLLAFVALLVGSAAALAAVPDVQRAAERFLWLLRGVDGEYAEAFDPDGRLARPIEIEEANLLLVEARDLAPKIGLAVDDVARIERAIARHAREGVVQDMIRELAGRVTAATGVVAQVLPPAPPSAERGATLFAENCASCHGPDGSGNGEESQRLGLAPANFRDVEFMRAETPDDFFNVLTLGRRRSGMPAWGEALSVQERWDLVRHVWSIGSPATDGAAPLPSGAAVPAPDALVRTSDAELQRLLADAGVVGTDAARWALVASLRAKGFDGLVGEAVATAPAPIRTPREILAEVHGLLDSALAAHRAGGVTALGLATDAYMRFEPVEKRLGALDPGLVRRLEEGFVRLRQSVRDPNAVATSEALIATLHRDLDEAVTTLEPGADGWVRFVQSAGIILREGFEVVLIVGALLAYVRRGGDAAMVRALYAGSVVGLVASVATAIALVTVFRVTPWAGEALEGVAMLLAAIVLFWVSYWLVSKAEADRWQKYIRGKVQGALTRRSGAALAAAAFLAVYREGFETILFYQALYATAPPGDAMVPAGLVAGLVLLAIVYVGLERVGLRIPMGTFFLVTGAFLYLMAFIFAGRGVFELQEAGVIALTPVDWAPRIEALGIFPTLESLAAQGVFLVLLAYAIGVTLWRRRSARVEAAGAAARPRDVAQG